MKRATIAVVLASQLVIAGRAMAAPDTYEDSESHPLRIAAYVLHPVGVVAEWLVFRPFHYLVSHAGPVFGHDIHGRKPQD